MIMPTFNPSLHPRAAGGKFGVANNPQRQKGESDIMLKGQLRDRAKKFREEASRLGLQIAGLRAQLRSLRGSHSTRSHAVAKKSSAKTPKGSKSGVAKKTPKTKKTRTKPGTSTAQATANQIGKLTYQISGM